MKRKSIPSAARGLVITIFTLLPVALSLFLIFANIVLISYSDASDEIKAYFPFEGPSYDDFVN